MELIDCKCKAQRVRFHETTLDHLSSAERNIVVCVHTGKRDNNKPCRVVWRDSRKCSFVSCLWCLSCGGDSYVAPRHTPRVCVNACRNCEYLDTENIGGVFRDGPRAATHSVDDSALLPLRWRYHMCVLYLGVAVSTPG